MSALLIMSLSGSVLAGVLLLVKPLLRGRLPQAAHYGLWLVVLASLLIPVSKFVLLPEQAAGLSLASVPAAIEQSLMAAVAGMNRSDPDSMAAPTDWPATNQAEADETTTMMSSPVPDARASESSAQAENPAFTYPQDIMADLRGGFMMVYPLAAGLILLYYIISFAYFLGKLRYRRIAPLPYLTMLENLYDGRRPLRLCLSPLVSTPMLVGLFRPLILLPDQRYTETQLKNVLLHELTHLRRWDIVIKWLSIIACALHWFNPLVWLIRREIDRACELSCDTSVIGAMNAADKKDYGRTLLSLASDARLPRAVLSVTMYDIKGALKERLASIKTFQQSKHKRMTSAFSALVIAVAIGAACAMGASTGYASIAPGNETHIHNPESVNTSDDEAALSSQFVVTYNYEENGGSSVTTPTEQVVSGEEVDLTPEAEKADGWIFIGWNTDQEAVTALTAYIMPEADLTLYAIYSKTLTATLIDYDGKTPTTPPRKASVTIYNKANDGEITLPAPNIYRSWVSGGWTDWEIRGWYAGPGSVIAPGAFTIGKDVTLYGMYQNPVTIKFDTKGGTTTLPDQTGMAYVTSNNISAWGAQSVTLPGAVAKEGYTFDGWTNSSNGNKYNAGDTVTPGVDVTYTAEWKPRT